MEERLQKILSAAGICSRRAAETYIQEGRVTVNGAVAALGDKADLEKDDICLDGRCVGRAERHIYLMLNKPRGYVTTLSDEKGRRTVVELVSGCGQRVYPVGRLDLDSEGLLLMTNDGAFTQKLTHPSHEVTKEYHVSVYGEIQGAAERLRAVTDLDGEPIRPAGVQVLRQTGQTAELAITIHEGKNRQIRRMCAACDLTVKRLRRVREHSLALGNLPLGKWRHLTAEELQALQDEV